ncbi:MAG: 23S rRNA (guanosine(2251)-2'-O)-methyltransferase RlmB [Candidatus Aminicenantes bacterium]|nr:MAG: 23S rRNA (guanosine(2251)-2'-O)-methyltransferase RlmB [Candidatus Aminicenantes bacterium]
MLEAVKHSPERVNKILIQEGTGRAKIAEIIGWAKKNRIPFFFLPPKKLNSIDPHHQGAIGLLAAKEYASLDAILSSSELPFLVLLDGIGDPQNLGAIIRTAEGAGVDGIVIPERRSVLLTKTVAVVASGALEHVKVARTKNLARTMDELRKKEVWLVGAEGGGEGLWHDFDYTFPVGLVFGSEGKGMRRLVRQKCDKVLSIPLLGRITSLNVAAAAAIFMYEVVRQRKCICR